ncbi:hypothetical protein [Neoroseomonas lacus]|uniref:Uncharacterized protein n=1 Tax=Neoroseomonas lacus TaxID=287609 RepID=A0A917NRY4_9PROT|nr:hypothetical protein [Neoroseomonas lacus]GGJ24122.1 hypothetical protein GCM10011320_34240 [Neoroseomonas lacus]
MSIAPQIVEVDGRRWRLLPESSPLPQAARVQALARAQLIDELTGEPPPGRAMVVSRTPGARSAAGEGGHIGLSGRPATLFPAAWPLVPPFPRLALEARLPAFLPVTLATDLVAQPAWPDAFLLHDFLQVALHRQPTLLSGRVASRTTGPVAGAAVEVTEIWTSFAAIGLAGLAPNALSLRAGLYADRPAGAALRRRTLTLQAPVRTLLRHAHAGETAIRLSDRQGLILNRPLAIEPGDPEREEYILIAAIDTGAAADLPAEVTLAHPLARAHDAGTTVQRTTFAAPGPANAITRAARRGDLSLFANGLNGIAPATPTIEVTGGGVPAEYHGIAPWRTTSDAEGAFRLPPIHRVAHLRLRASGGGQPVPAEIIVSLTSPGEAAADLLFP